MTVGYGKPADLWPKSCEMDLRGIRARFHTAAGDVTVRSPLTGSFNLQNLLVACAASLAAGADPEARGLERIEARLVGRDTELHELQGAVDAATRYCTTALIPRT